MPDDHPEPRRLLPLRTTPKWRRLSSITHVEWTVTWLNVLLPLPW
jgi:hypothetical protein